MISSPDLASSRSRLADWLEIRALFSSQGAGQATIASLFRTWADESHILEPDEDGEVLDAEILNSSLEDASSRIAEEVSWRQNALGEDYPFVVTSNPFHLELAGNFDSLREPSSMYLFMLLVTGAGDKLFKHDPELDKLVRRGRTLFHACASVGVAGLLRNAETVWLGWPREDGTAFLEALAGLCNRLGCGSAKSRVPAGFPKQAKDEGIDIVGWRGFRGQRNGNLVVLCQAATGHDWQTKSVLAEMDVFLDWFDLKPFTKPTGAIAIPFPSHHDCTEDLENGFEVAAHGQRHRLHQRLGVLIDRPWIVEALRCIGESREQTQRIDGLVSLPEIRAWIRDTISALASAA